ncbi:hypothetical protein CALVIDRAFT_569645 [Calocera viscosa TUFC12733]|uniref:Uncharacterized protein n=1 Tax=Calocera viscosa (strain TUFC12733) TaxID=1330018 RepID=A0A167FRH1_CALVF|nr:hypothetical protein CALVIDRAFT_569645 [Calocera viscosa TUFC12733]
MAVTPDPAKSRGMLWQKPKSVKVHAGPHNHEEHYAYILTFGIDPHLWRAGVPNGDIAVAINRCRLSESELSTVNREPLTSTALAPLVRLVHRPDGNGNKQSALQATLHTELKKFSELDLTTPQGCQLARMNIYMQLIARLKWDDVQAVDAEIHRELNGVTTWDEWRPLYRSVQGVAGDGVRLEWKGPTSSDIAKRPFSVSTLAPRRLLNVAGALSSKKGTSSSERRKDCLLRCKTGEKCVRAECIISDMVNTEVIQVIVKAAKVLAWAPYYQSGRPPAIRTPKVIDLTHAADGDDSIEAIDRSGALRNRRRCRPHYTRAASWVRMAEQGYLTGLMAMIIQGW